MVLIFQWNAMGIAAHCPELEIIITNMSYKPDIICLQETFLKNSQNFKFLDYICLRYDRQTSESNARGGVAILIKPGISYYNVTNIDGIEGLSVTISTGLGDVSIFNVYLSPSIVIPEDKLKTLFSVENAIVLGDFNAKSRLWGNIKSDQRGRVIENCLDSTELVLLNTGTPTHLSVHGHTSIDLAFCSPSLSLKAQWEVTDTTCGSDHYVLSIKFDLEIPTYDCHIPRWIFRKADWQKFARKCDDLFDTIIISNNLENGCNSITRAIIQAAKESIPISKGSGNSSKYKLFWNEECDKAVKNRDRIRRKYRKSNKMEDYIEFKKLKATATKVIKQAKRNKWKDFCSSLNRRSKVGKIWRVVKGFKTNQAKSNPIPSLKDGNETIKVDFHKANVLAKHFAFVSSTSNYTDRFQVFKRKFEEQNMNVYLHKKNDDNIINVRFDMRELNIALKKTRRTSPGGDLICYEMIKHMSNKSKHVLLNLFNSIWEQGIIPTAWKESIIVPILKEGKPGYFASSYRPIALTSNLCKLMERMVTNRLRWFLEKHKHLNINQSGFRQKRNTLDQLIRLSDDIVKSISVKGYTLGVFMDFEKAYDMVWQKGLLYKVHHLGIAGNMFNFIQSFLTERQLMVRVGATLSEKVMIENGTPQGSVISPLLFLIIVNDFSPPNVKASLFADDTAIWASSRNVKYLTHKIQKALEYVNDWTSKWDLKVSTDKSKFILFGRRKKAHCPIYINSVELTETDQVKFLGMVFDSKLTWKYHIDHLVNKCRKRINILKALTDSKWGANKQSILLLYKAIIRSCLDYGAEVYDSCCQSLKDRLNAIQAQCLRIATGALRTTPHSALLVECGEMPLQLRRTVQQAKAGVKYIYSEDNPTTESFQESWYSSYGRFDKHFALIYDKTKDIIHRLPKAHVYNTVDPIPYWIYNISVDLRLCEQVSKKDVNASTLTLCREFINSWQNYLNIYTDGSQRDGKTSCAFYISEFKVKHSFRLSDNTPVYTAELVAILEALRWLEDSLPNRVVIFSDSKSAIQAIDSHESLVPVVTDIKYYLYLFHNYGLEVVIAWVPSHVGIYGNEVVDSLARSALGKANIDLEIVPKVTLLYKYITQHISEIWQSSWDTCLKGRFYYRLIQKVDNKVKYSSSYRPKEVALTRIRFGHTLLNQHLHLMGLHPDGLCDICMVTESVSHFLLDCIQYQNLQEPIINYCINKNIPINIYNILTNENLLDLVWAFVVESHRKI